MINTEKMMTYIYIYIYTYIYKGFNSPTCLATQKSFDTTKHSVSGLENKYIYIVNHRLTMLYHNSSVRID